MNKVTRQSLIELNRRFYRRFAAAFSSSRERDWSGWHRLLEEIGPSSPARLRVLDLGCGNGRFATFLANRAGPKIEYLGMDSSVDLLETARGRLADASERGLVSASLEKIDVTSHRLEERLRHQRFDLIVLFGVLHHIPGLASRAQLMSRCASSLAAGGWLAVTLWQFNSRPGFARRVVPWEEYNLSAGEPLDLTQIEPRDYLLTWSGERRIPRYCHFTDESEISTLISAVGRPCRVRFAADGKSGDHNLYLVFGNGEELC